MDKFAGLTYFTIDYGNTMQVVIVDAKSGESVVILTSLCHLIIPTSFRMCGSGEINDASKYRWEDVTNLSCFDTEDLINLSLAVVVASSKG